MHVTAVSEQTRWKGVRELGKRERISSCMCGIGTRKVCSEPLAWELLPVLVFLISRPAQLAYALCTIGSWCRFVKHNLHHRCGDVPGVSCGKGGRSLLFALLFLWVPVEAGQQCGLLSAHRWLLRTVGLWMCVSNGRVLRVSPTHIKEGDNLRVWCRLGREDK